MLLLLDQNVPRAIAEWLPGVRPELSVQHTSDCGLNGCDDRLIYAWAQERGAIVVTFDEDFADRRVFPSDARCGIVRPRVWPTTLEETRRALERLLEQVPPETLPGALVIVGQTTIRIRSKRPPS